MRNFFKIFKKYDLRPWHLLVAGALLIGIGVVGMRNNYLHMVELRDDVLAADEAGNKEELRENLAELRNFVFTHMNTSVELGLQDSYNRAVDQAQKQALADVEGQDSVYAEATRRCKQPRTVPAQAQCFRNYIERHLDEGQQSQLAESVPKELYIVSYAAPTLSFDMAGIGIGLGSLVFTTGLTWLIIKEVKLHRSIYKRGLR